MTSIPGRSAGGCGGSNCSFTVDRSHGYWVELVQPVRAVSASVGPLPQGNTRKVFVRFGPSVSSRTVTFAVTGLSRQCRPGEAIRTGQCLISRAAAQPSAYRVCDRAGPVAPADRVSLGGWPSRMPSARAPAAKLPSRPRSLQRSAGARCVLWGGRQCLPPAAASNPPPTAPPPSGRKLHCGPGSGGAGRLRSSFRHARAPGARLHGRRSLVGPTLSGARLSTGVPPRRWDPHRVRSLRAPGAAEPPGLYPRADPPRRRILPSALRKPNPARAGVRGDEALGGQALPSPVLSPRLRETGRTSRQERSLRAAQATPPTDCCVHHARSCQGLYPIRRTVGLHGVELPCEPRPAAPELRERG